MATEDRSAARFQDKDPILAAHDCRFFCWFRREHSDVSRLHREEIYVDSFLFATTWRIRHAFHFIIQMMRQSTLYPKIWMLGTRPAHAVYFSSYEVSKELLSAGNPKISVAHAISGVFAAVSSGLVFTPIDMVNTRLLIGKYKGVLDCVKRVTQEEGLGAFYASYRNRIMTYAPYSAIHFATYEQAKRRLMEISPERECWLLHATAGAAAGAFAAAMTTPLYNVKARLSWCVSDYHHSARVSYNRNLMFIVKYEGFTALFRGCIPRMLLQAPATAIGWSTYEAAKSFFQNLNGNSNTA